MALAAALRRLLVDAGGLMDGEDRRTRGRGAGGRLVVLESFVCLEGG